MKKILLPTLVLACVFPLRAATSTSACNLAVPDSDWSGVVDTLHLGGLGAQPINDVNVSLHLAGGWNGDYYAYLWHEGQSAILLNRVGRSAGNPDGYSDGGFGSGGAQGSFFLDDQAAADVHFYRAGSFALQDGMLTGAWQPDGRTLDPEAPEGEFGVALRPAMLDVFNGMDANGAWSLFVVDPSPGAMGRLASWSITITQVPEPRTITLGVVVVGWLAAVQCWRRWCSRRAP